MPQRPNIPYEEIGLRLAATTSLEARATWARNTAASAAKLGAPKAITAMAHELARLVYRLLKWGHAYVDNVSSTTKRGLLLVAHEVA
jgi:hypothetical protein